MRYQQTTLFAAVFVSLPLAASAQTQATARADTTKVDTERQAQMARRGGGLRIGRWAMNGQQMPSGVSASATPSFEGYVRTGLDLHLVLENSVGVWRQRQMSASSGGLFGSGGGTADNYVIPQYTSVVFYPMTRPNDRLEPFARGGIGFALGVADPQSGGGITFTPGFGATGGLGLEWRATDAIGFAVSGRYQWVRFFQEFAGFQTYQGPTLEAGLTYRFQYR